MREEGKTEIGECPEGSEKDLQRAANALLNTLWQKVYSGVRTHDENWGEMDRQFPQARWLHEELKAARLRADQSPETKQPEVFTVGDQTMEQVFRPSGLTNVHDLQAVLDAVERALTPSPGTGPAAPNNERQP
jgi:hypothetical protein